MLTIVKGAVIVLALVAVMTLIISLVICATEADEEEIFTPEELAELRSQYACYEEGEIES